MALSGEIWGKWDGNHNAWSHERLDSKLTWSATQNVANNTSTITAVLHYYCAADLASQVSTNFGGTAFRITIDGTAINMTNYTFNVAGKTYLKIMTASRTISHKSDGTKTFSISAISTKKPGTWLGGPSGLSGSFTLNKINRSYTVKFYRKMAMTSADLISTHTVTHGGSVATPPNPTLSGYTFLGYWTTPEGDRVDAGSSVTNVTRDMNFRAVWKAKSYTVKFYRKMAMASTDLISTHTVTHGGSVATPPNPTLSGYTFLGYWTTPEGDKVNAGSSVTNVTRDMNFGPAWQVTSYTVKFYRKMAMASADLISTHTVVPGGSVTVPSDPTLIDYYFKGYWTTPEGDIVNAGSSVTNVTRDMNFRAVWDAGAPFYVGRGSITTKAQNVYVGTGAGVKRAKAIYVGTAGGVIKKGEF